jgi:hypothetical protein
MGLWSTCEVLQENCGVGPKLYLFLEESFRSWRCLATQVGVELRNLEQSSPKQTLNLLRSKPIVTRKVHGMQDNFKL